MEPGAVERLAANLSREHPWLEFVPPGALPSTTWQRLDTVDAVAWQRGLVEQNAGWYPDTDAPQVAAAFALQYLLQVPAHTLAYAVRLGRRASSPTVWWPDPGSLEFTIGPNLVPDRIRLPAISPEGSEFASGRLETRPEANSRPGQTLAERDYRAVAEPFAAAYPSIVRLGTATRQGMVTDMWAGALADGPVARESCCFLYALPGCHECAGCPRLR